MSRFAFEIPTEQEAREFLEWRRKNEMYQNDLHADALACQRRLRSVVNDKLCQCEFADICDRCHRERTMCRCAKPKTSNRRV